VSTPLALFEGYGVEIEYMIVDRETLSVRPLADRILEAVAGSVCAEVECGPLAWSNELVLHLIELKTNGPSGTLEELPDRFQGDVRRIDEILAPLGARLLPTGMHPWMDPAHETVLWPHEYGVVYSTLDRIFDCRGHGWANLQAVHLNLPFANDEEFARLHAAIRFLLPILPALSASSPFVEGRASGLLDNRIAFYRRNCRRVPSVTGRVIPEPVDNRSEYEELILGQIYRDLAPLDPEGTLLYEWVNARGAIARFDRQAIEIRLLDVQECPQADLAVCAAIRSVLQGLVDGTLAEPEYLRTWPTAPLAAILEDVACAGNRAVVSDALWLSALGLGRGPRPVRGVWRALLDAVMPAGSEAAAPWRETLDVILAEGCLARRLVVAAGEHPTRETLHGLYARVADCLSEGRLFHP
jgi:gamma-glutamyl:cysteine ligase YbdK (ATP-grasp superfamily)